jgi:hypothetical protein
MKKLLVLCAVLLLSSVIAYAGQKILTAQWEQTLPNPNDLQGWKLYYSTTQGGPYTLLKTIPFVSQQTTYTDEFQFTSPDGQRKQYFFVLTAIDTSGNESGYSNEASIWIDFEAPGVPVNLRITIKVQ